MSNNVITIINFTLVGETMIIGRSTIGVAMIMIVSLIDRSCLYQGTGPLSGPLSRASVILTAQIFNYLINNSFKFPDI